MQHITFAVFLWALVFTGHLNAQNVELSPSAEQTKETAEKVDASEGVLQAPAEQQGEKDKPSVEDDAQGNEELGPAIASVNEQGELVGRTSAVVNGDEVPIEANVTLVSGGVLLAKTVANEDGSFSFPNIHPGEYKIYGCASSFCGDRACTVVSDSARYERVQVQLDQTSVCGCNTGYAGAPVASFNGSGFSGGVGSGSFSSGSSFTGGGFGGAGGSSAAVGGGGVLGRRGFRLLAVGGIATAIALGASDDDEVSPSE